MMNRLFIIVLALVLDYAAIYAGDTLGAWGASGSCALTDQHGACIVLVVLSSFFAGVCGGLVWLISSLAPPHKSRREDVDAQVPASITACILFGLTFGVVSTPFTNFGVSPIYWASGWDVVLLISLLPMTPYMLETLADIVAARQNRKHGVTPI